MIDNIVSLIDIQKSSKRTRFEDIYIFYIKKRSERIFLKLIKRIKLTWTSLLPNANPIELDL